MNVAWDINAHQKDVVHFNFAMPGYKWQTYTQAEWITKCYANISFHICIMYFLREKVNDIPYVHDQPHVCESAHMHWKL